MRFTHRQGEHDFFKYFEKQMKIPNLPHNITRDLLMLKGPENFNKF